MYIQRLSEAFRRKHLVPLVAPSILACDWSKLSEEVDAVTAAGADLLHLDVMDGSFVPPITFGADFVAAVKRSTKLPLDVHLMIVQPERHLEAFAKAGAACITVHQEACTHLHRTVQRIHELGVKAGVAINPATPVSTLHEIVHDADLLLVMTVNPGWGGQAFITRCEEKIAEASALIAGSGRDVLLEVDGGINAQTAKTAVSRGANVLVAGSYVFGQAGKYTQAIESLRA